jgi:transcriptional regulator with XRE-family HTH domain
VDLTTLAAILRDGRQAIGMSRAELARRLGVTAHYVWQVEQANARDTRRLVRPSIAVLTRWSALLGWDERALHHLLILSGRAKSAIVEAPLPQQVTTQTTIRRPRQLERQELIERLAQVLTQSDELPDDAWRHMIDRINAMLDLIERGP